MANPMRKKYTDIFTIDADEVVFLTEEELCKTFVYRSMDPEHDSFYVYPDDLMGFLSLGAFQVRIPKKGMLHHEIIVPAWLRGYIVSELVDIWNHVIDIASEEDKEELGVNVDGWRRQYPNIVYDALDGLKFPWFGVIHLAYKYDIDLYLRSYLHGIPVDDLF